MIYLSVLASDRTVAADAATVPVGDVDNLSVDGR
jgi:hypothetical protein